MDTSSKGVPDHGPAAGAAAGTVVVRQSRLQRDVPLGVLELKFLLALVRGYPNAQTATGRVVLVVFVAAVTAALVLGWTWLIRHQCRLEISGKSGGNAWRLAGHSPGAGDRPAPRDASARVAVDWLACPL